MKKIVLLLLALTIFGCKAKEIPTQQGKRNTNTIFFKSIKWYIY